MVFKAKLTKQTRDRFTDKIVKRETIEIEASDRAALFALFFKEYDNLYRYCNEISCSLQDETLRNEYRQWLAEPANYAAAGGDMW